MHIGKKHIHNAYLILVTFNTVLFNLIHSCFETYRISVVVPDNWGIFNHNLIGFALVS